MKKRLAYATCMECICSESFLSESDEEAIELLKASATAKGYANINNGNWDFCCLPTDPEGRFDRFYYSGGYVYDL